MSASRPYVVALVAYQCPAHKNFRTLVVEHPEDGGGTRFATSKCCPKQYATEWTRWRFTADDVHELVDLLQTFAEQSP